MTEPTEEWRDELAKLPFEEAYRRLEDTVGRLEQGELSLADSEMLYRQGMELANRCQQLLTETELRITQIGHDRGRAILPSVSPDGDDSEWDLPPPVDPDDPSLFEDDDTPF
jgi:exodeoxyribonuclease VII small subunit